MKLQDILNIKNIASFIQGNAKYFFNKYVGLPKHIQEQVAYRLKKCKDDCLPQGKCKHCGCPPHKKAFVNKSCNKGERFPDLMSRIEWELYKKN